MPHRIIRSRYTGRRWVGCYSWYSEEGPGRAAAPPSTLLAVPNVTAHPSTASVPITVLLYDGPLLCSFNVAIKGLTASQLQTAFTNNWTVFGFFVIVDLLFSFFLCYLHLVLCSRRSCLNLEYKNTLSIS